MWGSFRKRGPWTTSSTAACSLPLALRDKSLMISIQRPFRYLPQLLDLPICYSAAPSLPCHTCSSMLRIYRLSILPATYYCSHATMDGNLLEWCAPWLDSESLPFLSFCCWQLLLVSMQTSLHAASGQRFGGGASAGSSFCFLLCRHMLWLWGGHASQISHSPLLCHPSSPGAFSLFIFCWPYTRRRLQACPPLLWSTSKSY